MAQDGSKSASESPTSQDGSRYPGPEDAPKGKAPRPPQDGSKRPPRPPRRSPRCQNHSKA
eukprot:6899826-Pyramimonas_sp.AAC.1